MNFIQIPKSFKYILQTLLSFAPLFLSLTVSFSEARAQGLGNSPYSTFGIGDTYTQGYASSAGMADVGVSTSNGFSVNGINPALLVRNRVTFFEVGLVGVSRTLNQTNYEKLRSFGANINNLVFAFPASSKWTLTIGLRPLSTVEYKSTLYRKIPNSIYEGKYSYNGSGGLNRVVFGNGFQVGKSLNLGVEASYVFGNIRRSSETQLLIGDSQDHLVARNDRTSVGSLAFKWGAAYRLVLKKDQYLNFGAVADFKTNLSAKQTSTFEITNLSGLLVANPDTIRDKAGSLTLPAHYRVGLSYEKWLKLVVSLEYDYQAWSQFRNIDQLTQSMTNTSGWHLGVDYIPRINSTKYFQLVSYRFGVNYRNTPYLFNGQNPKDLSASIGFTLPIGKSFGNSMNLGITGGRRGVIDNGAVQETYVRFNVGFSLSDRWFVKPKLD